MFLRHGETDCNVTGVTMGRIDTPLNDRGRRQAYEAAERLIGCHHPIKRLISSPLSRCSDTASVVATELGLHMETLDHLQERDWGVYQARPGCERPDTMTDPENGEPWLVFRGRCAQALNASAEQPLTLLVSHSGVYRGILSNLGLTPGEAGVPMRPINCVPYLFYREDTVWRIKAVADAA
jgi:broad specificity phosphatase PhoE